MSYQVPEPFENEVIPPSIVGDTRNTVRRKLTPEERTAALNQEGLYMILAIPFFLLSAIFGLLTGAPGLGIVSLLALMVCLIAGPLMFVIPGGGHRLLHAWRAQTERELERKHELALAEMKNQGIIEPHRLRGETEMYKADRDTEVSMKKIEVDLKTAANDFAAVGINASKERDLKQLDVDGKIIEMKTKLEATPQETRISKAQEQLVAIEKIQAVRVAADAFKMRDDDGKIIYVGGKPKFENSDDQAAYEAQMETYKRLLKQIAG